MLDLAFMISYWVFGLLQAIAVSKIVGGSFSVPRRHYKGNMTYPFEDFGVLKRLTTLRVFGFNARSLIKV